MATGLNLPPPQHDAEHKNSEDASPSAAQRFATGQLILPPPSMRTLIDKTASYISRNGPGFEEVLRKTDSEKKENRLPFLHASDPYHAYYVQTLDRLRRGEPLEPVSLQAAQQPQLDQPTSEAVPEEPEDDIQPPPPFLFSADVPTTTAQDLDIIKLTALFTAARGRVFATHLLQNENQSYQYEFLRPSHSLHPFFNRLVEQYQLVIEAPSGILEPLHDGSPDSTEGATVDARQGTGAGGERSLLLAQLRARTSWEEKSRERARQVQDEAALEKEAFAEIDWQDFVVVQTVPLFSQTSAAEDLPPPLSKRDLENMTLAQKKLSAMVEEEAVPVSGTEPREDEAMEMSDEEDVRPDLPPAQPLPSVKRVPSYPTPPVDGHASASPAPSIDESKGRSQVVKTAFSGPIRLRKDYVPGAKPSKPAEKDTLCPVCGQRVPLDEMSEHVRIELLNPMYREQRASLEARQAQHETLQSGADPVAALKDFAGQRTDIFGGDGLGGADIEADRRRQELAEQRMREAREREALAYDGHLASKTAIVERAKQAAKAEVARKPVSQPAPEIGPRATSGASNGASNGTSNGATNGATSGGLPRPPAGLPAKPQLDKPGGSIPLVSNPPSILGKHPADGPAPHEPLPQKPVSNTPAAVATSTFNGTLAPESVWSQAHPDPVALRVMMPVAPPEHANVPACDGREIQLEELPPSASISHVRQILYTSIFHESIGISRIRLLVRGKATTLKQTLAYWNLTENDEVAVVVKW